VDRRRLTLARAARALHPETGDAATRSLADDDRDGAHGLEAEGCGQLAGVKEGQIDGQFVALLY
jgi:hypothetical protein